MENEKKLFLPDDPIKEEGQDVFGHKALVDALYYCVTECEFKINIGLFGKWGVGKTSIVELLSKRLEGKNEKTKMFIFDAWKHSCSSLPHELILELNRKTGKFDQREIESKIYDISEGVPFSWCKRLFYGVKEASLTFVWPILFTVIIYGVLEVLHHYGHISDDWLNWLRVLVFIPLIVSILKEVALLRIDVGRVTILPAKSNPTKLRNIFNEIVQSIVGKGKHKQNKLIIVVDNLDRCSSEAAIDMLGAIKNLMEHDKCVYLFPCDRSALLSHLVNTRSYKPKEAAEFLRKFFQTSFVIPPFKPQDLEQYTANLMSELKTDFSSEVSEVITSAFTENPRSIKQFINNLTTQYILAKNREGMDIVPKGEITDHTGFLAKLLVIRQEYPTFYLGLERRNDLLEIAEEYFKNKSDPQFQEVIEPMFQREPGLEEFLVSTRIILGGDISTFLLLNKEIYPRSIRDAEEFKSNVNRGIVSYVVKSLNELKDERDIKEYVLRIIDLIEDNQKYQKRQSVFNGIDILIRIYNTMPESFKNLLANKIGAFATLSELQSEVDRYDLSLVFPIIENMDGTFRNRMLELYESRITPGKVDMQVIERLIGIYELMSTSAIDIFNEKLQSLFTGNREDANQVIRKLAEKPEAIDGLISDTTVEKVAESINESIDEENKGTIELYLILRKRASSQTRSDFLSKIISIISTNEDSSFDDTKKFGLQILSSLEREDIPIEGVGQLYDVLNKYTGLMNAPDEKLEFVKIFFKFFDIFEEAQQEEFLNNHLSAMIESAAQGILRNVIEAANSAGVKILKYDLLLDRFIDRVKRDLPDFELIASLTIKVPSAKKAKIKDMIIALINNDDGTYFEVGLKSVEQLQGEFSSGQIGEMCNACLERSKSTGMPDKQKFVETILKVFEKCPEQFKHRFSELTAAFILMDDQQIRDMGISCFQRIKDSIDGGQKEMLINQVIRGVGQKVSQNAISGSSEPVLELIIDEQSILNRNDMVRLVEILLDMRSEEKSKESKLVGIKYLGKIDRMYQRKRNVLSALKADAEVDDEDIKTQARQTIEELGMTRKKLSERKEEESKDEE